MAGKYQVKIEVFNAKVPGTVYMFQIVFFLIFVVVNIDLFYLLLKQSVR